MTGSSDLYQSDSRRPAASVNFVTAHDGFTLRDLVSFNDKHNEANGEAGADGEGHNRSWNCGTEGPSDDPAVVGCRAAQQRNFLLTLLLSQGVPMILGGDELGRTQQGNNNAYCQDNETSWFDWSHVDTDLLDFVRRLISLRREHPVFRRRRWFQGRPIRGAPDIAWIRPDGLEMADEDWESGFVRAVGLFLNGDAIPDQDDRGQPIRDDSFLLLFNAHDEQLEWDLPTQWGDIDAWRVVITTAQDGGDDLKAGVAVVASRSVLVLMRPRQP